MQSLYAAIGDCADGKLSEEELAATLEQAGQQLDEREQRVVEGLLNSK
jgi:DNA-directed RNA polymerase specialized sigma subunit